jgi:hypothetical protein
VQTSQKPEQAQTSQKPEQVQTSQKPEQVQTSQKPEQVQTSQKPEHARGTDQRQSAVLTSKANDLNQSKSLTLEQPETLDDALSNLAKKVTALGEDHHKAAGDTTQDELGKIASKFDSVQMDFSGEAGNTQTALTQVQLQKSVQNREALLKMIQQEGLESDRAFNDFLKQSAAQNAMMEGHALDRVNALNQLKSAQIERLNLQDLRQDALLAQQQMKEFQAGQPSQWKTLDELSPDQIAMMDSLSGMNNGLASEKTLGFSQTLPQSVQARLTTQEQQDFKPTDATQGAVDPHALFSSLKSDGNPTSGFSQNGSSFAGQSNRNEIGQAASSSSVRVEDTDFASQDKAQQAKADARARESERTREMARNAAQRAQTIAAELAAKGGGTARVQIKDSQLGVVELRINMSDNNRMNVELVANSDRIKLELEKQAGALKDGLEKHKLVVDGVHFATDMKLGESSFQSSTQTDSQNQQQPSAQNQQGFNSFAQNSSGQGQGGFEQERFFEPQRLVNVANQRPQVNARQSYTGKNESQTNIQRNANGSLKVTA